MFDKKNWEEDCQEAYKKSNNETITIDDVEKAPFELLPGIRFILGLAIGVFFFFIPVSWRGEVTIPFDILFSFILESYTLYARWLTFTFAVAGTVLTVLSIVSSQKSLIEENINFDLDYWNTSYLFAFIRVLGMVFLISLALKLGPDIIYQPLVQQLWSDFVPIFIIIVPLGAILVNLLTKLGGLDFIGTLARPLMKPLFKLPGKSALDSIASIFGTSLVGYYVTYEIFNNGGYNKREAGVLVTCFVTPSLGSVALVAGFVEIVYLLPVIILTWFTTLLITGFILVRIPPLNRIPQTYVTQPDTEPEFVGSINDYFWFAVNNAMRKVRGQTFTRAVYEGSIEGFKIVALVTTTVITFALPLFLLVELTDFFAVVSSPLVPIIDLLGIPNAEVVAMSVLIGAVLDILPAAVAGGIGVRPMAAFYIIIISLSQLLYLSYSIPIVTDMFRNIPIRLRDLILVFIIRTILLIPIAAMLTHIVSLFGVFE